MSYIPPNSSATFVRIKFLGTSKPTMTHVKIHALIKETNLVFLYILIVHFLMTSIKSKATCKFYIICYIINVYCYYKFMSLSIAIFLMSALY